jgi:diguanylate cyclase (GGDEF)-like protein
MALAAGALVAVAVLLQCLRHRQRQAEEREMARQRELENLERRSARVDVSLERVSRFLRELPHVAHEMHAGANVRKIPGLLLTCLVRFFEPTRALVAIRRRGTAHDPERRSLFTVAASYPDNRCVAPGTEFLMGQGELGFVAESQRVMNRGDFDSLPASARLELSRSKLPGMTSDLVAPLVYSGETVAVIGVQGLGRWPLDTRDVIRVIAQVGALAVHSLERYTQLKATASLDGLTGVFNKRFLNHRLSELIREASPGERFSVFLFDIDNFKHYNDRNGHVAGDMLLRHLARLVQENVRKESTFGRFGGEEFLLILPGASKSEALSAADNVRELIADFRFAEAGAQPLGCVSISGGVAEHPLDGQEASTLLENADQALYEAKKQGRNRVLAYEPGYLGSAEAVEPVEKPALLRPDSEARDDDPTAPPADAEGEESSPQSGAEGAGDATEHIELVGPIDWRKTR